MNPLLQTTDDFYADSSKADSLEETATEFSEPVYDSEEDINTSYRSFSSLNSSKTSMTVESSASVSISSPHSCPGSFGYEGQSPMSGFAHRSMATTSRFSRSRKTLSIEKLHISNPHQEHMTSPRGSVGFKLNRIVQKLKHADDSGPIRTEDGLTREETIQNVKLIWENEVIPHFEQKKNTNSVRELFWKGIPPKHRGKVWSLAIGNSMNITEELYTIMVKNARTNRTAIDLALKRGMNEAAIEEMFPGKVNSLAMIKLDLERTFPELGFFTPGTPEFESLQDVLEAYVAYRPDVGYVQGMSYIAAMLLLNMSACESFVCLAHLLNSNHMRALFRMEPPEIDIRFAVFDHLLLEYLPETAKHFQQLNITSSLYVVEWFMTIYARLLNLELSTRLWDLYVLDGELFAFRAGLGIIKILSPKLLKSGFDKCMKMLTNISRDISETKTVRAIRSIRLTPAKYRAAVAHFTKVLGASSS